MKTAEQSQRVGELKGTKPAIQRKAVDLDEETIISLTGQAIRAKKSLKPYMEDVLIGQANPEVFDHYMHLIKCRDILTAICKKVDDLNSDLLPEIVEAMKLLNLCGDKCPAKR